MTNTARYGFSHLLFLLIAAAISVEAWAQAGIVQSMSGNAFATNAAGVRVPLKPGSTFAQGLTLRTGEGDELELAFEGGQVLMMGEDSAVMVQEVRSDPKDPKSGKLVLQVLQGSVRLVSPGGDVTLGLDDESSIRAGGGGVDFVLASGADGRRVLSVERGEIGVTTPQVAAQKVVQGQVMQWTAGVAPGVIPFAALPAGLAASISRLRARSGSAALLALLESLAPPGAGQPAAPSVAPLPPVSVSPGGGGGCLGSPC